jgi:hypothetical protein
VTPTVFEAPSASSSRSFHLTEPTRSPPRILHHALDVKRWIAARPSVAAARPGACPACGAPSQPLGGPLGLHGHGLRDRQVCGPAEAEGRPGWIVIACRRYRCVHCGAVLTVVPRGIAPRRHYGHAAIAMALALWAIAGRPSGEVRELVCARRIRLDPARRWPTLTRWARAAAIVAPGGLRAAAARVAQIAIGRAPPALRGAPRWAQAFAGGSCMP